MKLKEWQKILLIIVASFVVVGVFYLSMLSTVTEGAPPVARNSFLELTIAGEIPERTIDDPLRKAVGDIPNLSVKKILQTLHKAKIDDKIVGIILRPLAVGTGWAKTEEIRNALLDFKSTGKPIYAYLEMATKKEYYLASVADSIMGISTGILLINGFLSEPIFLKETLSKIGVEADFIAHGKYKNAPDMFTREDISDAQREVTNSILDQFYGNYVSSLASARSLDEARIREIIDQSFYSLEAARQLNLLDSLMYYHDFKEYIKKKRGGNTRFVSISRYEKVPMSRLGVSAKHTLAVIYGSGTIVIGGEDQFGQDGIITSEGMAKSIRQAAEDDDIQAIILRIDSPGGSGTASDVIWREVVRAKQKKPVIVSISDVAASGGYYISMAADTIVAHPNSIVGSIGVFAGKFSLNKLYDKIGMNLAKIYRGENAGIFSESQKFTPEQRTIIREFIMEFYRDFVQKVAEERAMTAEQADEISQGRVWTGQQGYENGLVDVLGDFDTAVDIAKQMAGIPEDEAVGLILYPKLKSFLERLFSDGFSAMTFDPLSDLKQIPMSFRSTVLALPHFRSGEPLFLYTYNINLE